MKKTTKFALTSLAAGVAFAALTSTAQAQEQWTMTSTWPENLDLIKIDQHWAELVNQLAGDEVQINFRAGGTLMPGTEVFDATETKAAKRITDSFALRVQYAILQCHVHLDLHYCTVSDP